MLRITYTDDSLICARKVAYISGSEEDVYRHPIDDDVLSDDEVGSEMDIADLNDDDSRANEHHLELMKQLKSIDMKKRDNEESNLNLADEDDNDENDDDNDDEERSDDKEDDVEKEENKENVIKRGELVEDYIFTKADEKEKVIKRDELVDDHVIGKGLDAEVGDTKERVDECSLKITRDIVFPRSGVG